MSKSLDNYISVVDTPKDMFGKTMRVSDELMFRFYQLLTDLTPGQVQELQQQVQQGVKHPRTVKVGLAKFLVSRFHSAQAADQAEEEFNRIFVDKGLPDEMGEFKVTSAQSLSLVHLMVQVGFATSNSEAARLIKAGGVQIDQGKVSDPQLKIALKAGESFVLKVGKKNYIKVMAEGGPQ